MIRQRVVVAAAMVLASCGSPDPAAPPTPAKPATPARPGKPAAPRTGATVEVLPPGLALDNPTPPQQSGYRIIPSRSFRYSSVRGDFRIYTTAAGIVVSWKTMLSARTPLGAPLWTLDGQGRAVAVSPDGARLVTNNDAGQLLILDTKTGAPIGSPTQLGGPGDPARHDVWISAFAWLPDGKHILALDFKRAYVLRGDGSVERELPVACKSRCFLSSAVALSNDEVIIANSAGTFDGQILRVNVADGTTLAAVDFNGSDPDLSVDRTRILVDGSSELAMLDAHTLRVIWKVDEPGYQGVKTSAGASSSEEWKSMPKLSPDGAYVVVNDRAGRLWLIDARDGSPLLAYPTDFIDYVEDVLWYGDGTLIAIDNDGHVIRFTSTPAHVVWSKPDGPERAQRDTL